MKNSKMKKHKLRKKLMTLGTVTAAMTPIVTGFSLQENYNDNTLQSEQQQEHKVYQVGHRGASAYAPENTRYAFQKALDMGFDGIETDVHMTKDGYLVLIHDETIDRTSDKKGAVKDLTLDELRQADFGKISKDPSIPKQTIMTLNEFYEEFGNQFQVMNMEIKTDKTDYPGIEQKVVDITNEYKIDKNKVMFSGFNFDTLRNLHKIDKTYKLAWIWNQHFLQFKKVSTEEIKEVVTYLNPIYTQFNLHRKEYEALGMQFNFWTLIDYERVSEKIMDEDMAYSMITNSLYEG